MLGGFSLLAMEAFSPGVKSQKAIASVALVREFYFLCIRYKTLPVQAELQTVGAPSVGNRPTVHEC